MRSFVEEVGRALEEFITSYLGVVGLESGSTWLLLLLLLLFLKNPKKAEERGSVVTGERYG